ncbi:hypothetical protein Cgig2_030751 [Carnegiea gigantea]|uniref:Uncharacterized protein n=1 Tax=Carnegiea gigantea TaxID=171969 RepID=A0A9Q1KS84_9CARY|nr:hypothetical protein Cgig2_030751 [Carnegiea gigantea]
MEADFLDDWKRLSLLKVEDEVIGFEADETKDVKAQVSLCLVRKLNTTGNKIDAFVEVDQLDMLIPSKALKLWIDCNLHKPICQGLMLKRLLRLRDPNNGLKAKMKLNFTNGSPSAMNIDHVPITVTGEMVKRKRTPLLISRHKRPRYEQWRNHMTKIVPKN